jgi:hypothetical protein
VSSKNEILFEEESQVLTHYQALSEGALQETDFQQTLKVITGKYKELLDQTKFLTRISDRLENRLQSVNQTLAEKNVDLKAALDELTRARASKQAYLIIYTIAGILFVFEEFFIDPVIAVFGNVVWMVILFKLCIALLLKPTEMVLENRMLLKIKQKRKL